MTRLESAVPGVASLRSYERGWLRRDLVAGVVLAAILVPQGMAYAELAGLPPVTGLYTTIACLVGYALMGPSRVLVLGPDSSVSPLIFAAIAPLVVATDDPDDGDRARRDDGAHGRADPDRAGGRQARLRRRPALEGGPGRLHERAGDHDHRRPAAQAVRVLDRRRRLRRRGAGVRRRVRRAQLDGARARPRHAGRPARAASLHTHDPGRPRRGRRCHRGDRGVRPRHRRRSARSPRACPGRRCPGPTSATSGRCSSPRSASRWSR